MTVINQVPKSGTYNSTFNSMFEIKLSRNSEDIYFIKGT